MARDQKQDEGGQGHDTSENWYHHNARYTIYRHYCRRCDAFTYNVAALDRATGLATIAEVCPLCGRIAATLPAIQTSESSADRADYWRDYHDARDYVRALNHLLLAMPTIDSREVPDDRI